MAVLVLSSTHSREPFLSLERMVEVSSRVCRAVRSSSMNWPGGVVGKVGDVAQVGLLGLIQVGEQPTRGLQGAGVPRAAGYPGRS